jgi:hypothetical protein
MLIPHARLQLIKRNVEDYLFTRAAESFEGIYGNIFPTVAYSYVAYITRLEI